MTSSGVIPYTAFGDCPRATCPHAAVPHAHCPACGSTSAVLLNARNKPVGCKDCLLYPLGAYAIGPCSEAAPREMPESRRYQRISIRAKRGKRDWRQWLAILQRTPFP
jgi:hypothetical protein